MVGNPDGDIVKTYVPLNSNYGPDLAASDFELITPPLTNYGYPTSRSDLGNTSGDSFGERCDFLEHKLIEFRQVFGECLTVFLTYHLHLLPVGKAIAASLWID